MKRVWIIGFMTLYSIGSFGQVGINGGFSTFVADEWMDLIGVITDNNFENPSGFQFGADYRFRLKQRRVEFLPELGYGKYYSDNTPNEVKIDWAGFYLNTNVYPFNFEGDCDCPTWSKSGGIFEKGFFVQVSPGINWTGTKVKDELKFSDENEMNFSLGIGAGIDIGLSEFVTVSPMVRYSISNKTEYLPSTNSFIDFEPASSNIKQLYLGMRLGLNFKK